MDIALTRERIKAALDLEDDERILAIVKKILSLNNNQQLSVLTKRELIARAFKSGEEIKNGNFITLEELEKEMANW